MPKSQHKTNKQSAFKKDVSKHPTVDLDFNSILKYADTLVRQSKDKDAIPCFDVVLSKSYDPNDEMLYHSALIGKAEALFHLKEYSAALDLYEEVLKKFPNDTNAELCKSQIIDRINVDKVGKSGAIKFLKHLKEIKGESEFVEDEEWWPDVKKRFSYHLWFDPDAVTEEPMEKSVWLKARFIISDKGHRKNFLCDFKGFWPNTERPLRYLGVVSGVIVSNKKGNKGSTPEIPLDLETFEWPHSYTKALMGTLNHDLTKAWKGYEKQIARMSKKSKTGANEPQLRPGEIIRRDLIDALGYSVEEAAQKTGLDEIYLHHVLAGRRSITTNVAVKLSKLFDECRDRTGKRYTVKALLTLKMDEKLKDLPIEPHLIS